MFFCHLHNVFRYYLIAEYLVLPNPNYKIRTIVIAIVSVLSVALVIALSYLGYRMWRRKEKVRSKIGFYLPQRRFKIFKIH